MIFDDAVKNGMLGLVAGDALGVPVEFQPREKLERDPAQPEHIMTKWGVGYYFKE